MYSTDGGVSYTGIGSAIFTTQGNDVVWTGKYFVAVGSGTYPVAYSSDGNLG